MDKVRIHEIAKELAAHSKDVLGKAIEMGLDVKSAQSTLTMQEADKLMHFITDAPKVVAKPTPTVKKVEKEETAIAETSASTETKVVSSTQEPVKTADTKEATAVVEPAKDAPVLTPRVEPKKRGLKIVKKKRPAVVAPEVPTRTIATQETHQTNYGKMSDEARKELENRRKKSARRADHSKQEHGKSIDILGGGEIATFDIEEEQVVLIDYRDEQAKIDLAEQLKKEADALKALRAKQQQNGGQRRPNFNQNRSISRGGRKKRRRKVEDAEQEIVTSIEIPEDIRVYEFAEKINRGISEVITVLFNLGMMVTKNDFLGKDEIEILAEEFEVEVHTIDLTDEFNYEKEYEDEGDDKDAVERAPIVTIMGHVDHGKTSLLDSIRTSRIANKEAVGITQHIGAYSVVKNDKLITFLDTPGHAAFSAMRSRGAEVTDIIIIVVAADDGVKPQTLEAIKHAKASGAPIIVAMNKMDKPEANPDLVKGQMAEHDLNPSDWGGDIEFIPVSAKTGEGIEDLLENILVQAEVLELKANPALKAKATIVESTIEKGRGPVATIIMQNGTLRVGDNIVAAASYGRVKAMLDENKKPIQEVGPSQTCVVVGLDVVPASGEILISTTSDKEAKEFANKRHEHDRHKELSQSTKTSLDELSAMIAEGNLKALKVILKADVHGSLEAIRESLETLRNDEVKITIISSAVGGITQNDVDLARNSENVFILGFNVRPTGAVKASAKQAGVEIKTYSIIYEMIDDMTAVLSGMMSKVMREENTGQASIKEVFSIPGGKVAGCMVDDGKIVRGGKIRVIRDGVVLHVTTVSSLRRFKDEVKDVGKGYECGIVLDGYNDIVAGDVFETFIEIEEKAEL